MMSATTTTTTTTLVSPLLSLPREIRDNPSVVSEIIFVNDQPFRIKSGAGTHSLYSKSRGQLAQTCKQIDAEYSHLLRRAAFTPGPKTMAPVYDFNFSEMIKFVKGLTRHEITAANKNRNLVVNLFVFDVKSAEAQRLIEWLRVCETTGIELSYVVQWTSFDLAGFKSMEAVVRRTKEGQKILKALGGKNVSSWSWEGYQASLREQGR